MRAARRCGSAASRPARARAEPRGARLQPAACCVAALSRLFPDCATQATFGPSRLRAPPARVGGLGPVPARSGPCSRLPRHASTCSRQLSPVPVCSDLLRPAPACSGLLRPAPACSGLLRSAPACSGLLRSAPVCSGLLRPALPGCGPVQPARSQHASGAPRPPAAPSSVPSLVHLAFFALCLVFLVTSFSLISTLKAVICGYSPVIRPAFTNGFYYTIAVNLNTPEPE